MINDIMNKRLMAYVVIFLVNKKLFKMWCEKTCGIDT